MFSGRIGCVTLALVVGLILCARVDAADLLVASDGPPNNGKLHGVLRYDGVTGAFLGRFTNAESAFAMTYGPDGNLYVGNTSSGSINRYNGVSGAFLNTFVPGGSGGLAPPYDITFGPDGNLYTVNDGPTPGVLRYNGTTGAFIDRFTTQAATGLTFGPDGNLYVSTGEGVVVYSGVDGSKLEDFIQGNFTLSGPYHLRFGPDGNMYVMNVRPGVRQYEATSGAYLRDFAVPPDLNNPLFLGLDFVFGPDGNLYMNNGAGSGVMRFNGTSGDFLDQFVALGSGGLDQGRSMVFMVPEPGIVLSGFLGAMALCRRRRIFTGI